jgi:uncharacterized membrane protein
MPNCRFSGVKPYMIGYLYRTGGLFIQSIGLAIDFTMALIFLVLVFLPSKLRDKHEMSLTMDTFLTAVAIIAAMALSSQWCFSMA